MCGVCVFPVLLAHTHYIQYVTINNSIQAEIQEPSSSQINCRLPDATCYDSLALPPEIVNNGQLWSEKNATRESDK